MVVVGIIVVVRIDGGIVAVVGGGGSNSTVPCGRGALLKWILEITLR